jgi:hypothetical protein
VPLGAPGSRSGWKTLEGSTKERVTLLWWPPKRDTDVAPNEDPTPPCPVCEAKKAAERARRAARRARDPEGFLANQTARSRKSRAKRKAEKLAESNE